MSLDPKYEEVLEALDEFQTFFKEKASDYQAQFTFLGPRAQVVDIGKKWFKIKAAIWDGQDMTFEDSREMAMDIIGHALLLIYMLDHPEEEGTIQ